MANTTSGTTTFDKNFSIDEIIEEAFERLGIQNVSGYQLKTSRRSLNILLRCFFRRSTKVLLPEPIFTEVVWKFLPNIACISWILVATEALEPAPVALVIASSVTKPDAFESTAKILL